MKTKHIVFTDARPEKAAKLHDGEGHRLAHQGFPFMAVATGSPCRTGAWYEPILWKPLA